MALGRFFFFRFFRSPCLLLFLPFRIPVERLCYVMRARQCAKEETSFKVVVSFSCEYVLYHYVVADETMFGCGSVFVLLFIIFIPFFFGRFFSLFSRLSPLSMVLLYLLLIITTAASLVRTALWIFASAIVFVGVSLDTNIRRSNLSGDAMIFSILGNECNQRLSLWWRRPNIDDGEDKTNSALSFWLMCAADKCRFNSKICIKPICEKKLNSSSMANMPKACQLLVHLTTRNECMTAFELRNVRIIPSLQPSSGNSGST